MTRKRRLLYGITALLVFMAVGAYVVYKTVYAPLLGDLDSGPTPVTTIKDDTRGILTHATLAYSGRDGSRKVVRIAPTFYGDEPHCPIGFKLMRVKTFVNSGKKGRESFAVSRIGYACTVDHEERERIARNIQFYRP